MTVKFRKVFVYGLAAINFMSCVFVIAISKQVQTYIAPGRSLVYT